MVILKWTNTVLLAESQKLSTSATEQLAEELYAGHSHSVNKEITGKRQTLKRVEQNEERPFD